MSLKEFELGYTPRNLKIFLEKNSLKQKDAREILGKGRNTFSRYLYDYDNSNHVTMAHVDWLKLLEFVKNRNLQHGLLK